MTLPTPCWYVVQLRPNAGTIAIRNLQRQGFRVFAPFEEVTRRRGHRFVRVNKPLFPGYLFVALDPDNAGWRAINSTFGVCRLVCSASDSPTMVPDGLVSGLMQRCDPAGRLLPADHFAAGEVVRIAEGPFAEYVATIERMSPGERAWVLLDIMGKQTRVTMRPGDLRRMHQPPTCPA